jgi:hypothetical protein
MTDKASLPSIETEVQIEERTRHAMETYFNWLQNTMSASPWTNADLNKKLLSYAKRRGDPQKERMEAAIYFPLFLVLVSGRQHSIFYLSADLQTVGMFKPRTPLSDQARRVGWQGFIYDLSSVRNNYVRLK